METIRWETILTIDIFYDQILHKDINNCMPEVSCDLSDRLFIVNVILHERAISAQFSKFDVY